MSSKISSIEPIRTWQIKILIFLSFIFAQSEELQWF